MPGAQASIAKRIPGHLPLFQQRRPRRAECNSSHLPVSSQPGLCVMNCSDPMGACRLIRGVMTKRRMLATGSLDWDVTTNPLKICDILGAQVLHFYGTELEVHDP